MSVSALLRERGAAIWSAAVSRSHGGRDRRGSLPHGTFRYYFEQNVRYLEDYARAIALIIGHASGRRDITVLTRFLGQIVDTELPANYSFLARLGGREDARWALPRTPTPGTCWTVRPAGTWPPGWPRCCPASGATGSWPGRWPRRCPPTRSTPSGSRCSRARVTGTWSRRSTGLLDARAAGSDEARLAGLAAVFDRSTRLRAGVLGYWPTPAVSPTSAGTPRRGSRSSSTPGWCLARGITGRIDESATASPVRPATASRASTTVLASAGSPIRQVPQWWL